MADRWIGVSGKRMGSARTGGSALVGACVAALAMALGAAAAASGTHFVVIEQMRFNPQALTVKKGDRVVWVNKDLFPHTASAGSKAFDSGSIAANASWSYVARQPGSYPYTCQFHPLMHGTLIVR